MITESEIKSRISEINKAISDLIAERIMLFNLVRNQIIKSRLSEVRDKRSYKRLYNEEKIKGVIIKRKGESSFKYISQSLLSEGVIMKDATLRSYLTRMGQSGQIQPGRRRGYWKLNSKPSKSKPAARHS